jgi:hypothetical protein
MVRTVDIYVKKPFLRDDVLLKLQLFLSQPNPCAVMLVGNTVQAAL